MKKIVVVDIDREEFRFAVGGVHRRSVKLLAAGVCAWRPAEEGVALSATDQGKQIREQLKSYKVAKSPLVLFVDRTKVEELHLSLPPVADSELPQLVINQAVLESPGMTEETIIDFVPEPLESFDAPRKIVAFALLPKELEHAKTVAQQIGLPPTSLQYRPYSAAVPAQQLAGDSLDITSLLVTLYRDEVELSLVDGEEIPLSRHVRLPGLGQDDNARLRLIGEIRRTLLIAPQHLKSGRQVTDLRLQGTAALIESLSEQIQSESGLPVLKINVFDQPELKLPDGFVPTEGLVPLLGALILAAHEKKPLIDFLNPRKPVVRRSNKRAYVFAGIFLAIAGYFGFEYLQQQAALTNKSSDELKATLADLKNRLKKIDKERKVAEALQQWETSAPNWLDELRDLSVKIPPGQDVTLSRISMSPGRGAGGLISFSAAARTPEAVVALETALRDERHAIQTPGITPRSDKNYPWGFESSLSVQRRSNVSEEEKKAPETQEKAEKTGGAK